MFGLFKGRVTPVPTEDEWVIAQGTEQQLPVIYRFRAQVPRGVRTAQYPRLVNLYWRYEPGREEGMPGPEDYERMLALEDKLDGIEGRDVGYLVLSITGNSRKEWIWQVRSDDLFISALNNQLVGEASFPIEIEANDDPEWNSYFALQRGGSGT